MGKNDYSGAIMGWRKYGSSLGPFYAPNVYRIGRYI
jgi:hypothetical protein